MNLRKKYKNVYFSFDFDVNSQTSRRLISNVQIPVTGKIIMTFTVPSCCAVSICVLSDGIFAVESHSSLA